VPLSTDVAAFEGKVRSALVTALLGVSGFPTNPAHQGWENRPFTPPAQTTHFRFRLVMGEPTQMNIGRQPRLLRYRGTAAVDLYFPAGDGTVPASTLGGAIVAAFPPGHELTYSDQRVRITKAVKETGKPGSEWFHVPVTITWWADVLDTSA
jgi:hypothetical protein